MGKISDPSKLVPRTTNFYSSFILNRDPLDPRGTNCDGSLTLPDTCPNPMQAAAPLAIPGSGRVSAFLYHGFYHGP